MLNLKLRDEFLKKNLKGTVIDFRSQKHDGATEVAPEDFLKITYPTADVLNAVNCLREDNLTGPVVLMGGRGKGKSHLMAVLHHCIKSPDAAERWLTDWSTQLGIPALSQCKIRRGYHPITEKVNDCDYDFLWDLIFDRHPRGQLYKGKFQATNSAVPSRALMEEMFNDVPTCLILDEFQTWYDNLPEQHKGYKVRANAFSFVQTLSEIAKESPDTLVFIVSVRENSSEAFKQIHRQTPVLIDFSGDTAKEDRKRLILHRLFENRQHIPSDQIAALVQPYASERYRLIYEQDGRKNAQKVLEEVCLSWPFAPELLDLLEDQILMAAAAQETRDMIRVLAMVYKSRGEDVPVVTSALFSVEGDSGEVQALVDSIANQAGQSHLREIAKRNVAEVKDSGEAVPRLSDMVASIWMHSMAPGRTRGAQAADVQLALAGVKPIDDNEFNLQMQTLVDNSVNIHDDPNTKTYWFEQEVNPRARVRVTAKNENLWKLTATASALTYPGKDTEWIQREMRKCYVSEAQSPSQIVVLGPNWQDDNWIDDLPEQEKPNLWSRQMLLVVPDVFPTVSAMNAQLGKWLALKLSGKRNTIRFLVQTGSGKGIYDDTELRFAARCSYLCSREAWGRDYVYQSLFREFTDPLEKAIKERFTHFAVLQKWDFGSPDKCEFAREPLTKRGIDVPPEVEQAIEERFFEQDEFEERLVDAAKDGKLVSEFIDELKEPTPGDTAVYLGEQRTLSHIQQVAAQGKIAINVDGTWYAKSAGQSADEALVFIRQKTSRAGNELKKMQLGPATNAGGGVTPPTPQVAPMPVTPVTPENPSGPVVSPTVSPGDSPVVAPPVAQQPAAPKRHSAAPANASTLQGKFEEWGLIGKKLKSTQLTVEGISVEDLKKWLLRLPSKYKAAMEVEEEAQ